MLNMNFVAIYCRNVQFNFVLITNGFEDGFRERQEQILNLQKCIIYTTIYQNFNINTIAFFDFLIYLLYIILKALLSILAI